MATATGGYTVKRGRLKGIEVKPGSVRQARLEAGLSLAGVAGSDLTRAAIHLIETGKSRPSMPTLELIARRTGKPLSFFLAPEGSGGTGGIPAQRRMAELERLVESDDHAAVIEAATELLTRTTDTWDLGRMHLWIGRALIQLRRASDAVQHARVARDLFERLGDEWLAVEALDWEASALYMEQEPSALELTQEALERCRRLEPAQPALEARILSHLAAIHNLRYDWDSAVKNYEAALALSEQIRDLGRLARMYQGLGISYDGMGRPDQALAYTNKALAIYSMLNDQVSIAATENSLGLVLLKLGDVPAAERQLRSSIDHFNELGITKTLSHSVLSLAELELSRGGLDEADRLVRQAMTLATEHQERLSIGLGHQYLGQVAAGRGEHEECDRSFALALEIFGDEEALERLIDCHSAYAHVLEDRGDTRGALEQTKRALAVRRPSLSKPAASGSTRSGASAS
jgi:tetratricopeptide (TPR) repeat protein